ncbi:hypothetical protein F892_03201 [Acinetobacter vivianii]|uniref:DUF4124 domain-containing protein n=1 Tax=Acinetobacter vivianii TaxID=1776742 RepID=N9PZS7_9GAMM|nr:hypothetical protein [Acinetobacter vivianii]ENX20277.1 hypothetical protein F892_03201 [Acinetobacter vivianii]MEB6667841.1 hypothetical protein [Acinetobacter vivianii]GGI59275.1 hypothetical protein GCM10011446_07700 [Acinetobacter vivianii]
MKLSLSTKIVVVTLLVGVCSTQTNARRLYKWVDQTSVTNYSEFQPKEGTSRKLEVLESRGNDHVDPAMAVTAEMKAIEIPVDQMNLQGASSVAGSTPTAQLQQPITQTIVKQGAIAAPYTRPVNAAATTTGAEKKEPQLQQTVQALEKKESVSNPSIEKAVSPVVVSEKKDEVALVQPEKKVQPKVNPWTRKVEFVPSNLVPQNLTKASAP